MRLKAYVWASLWFLANLFTLKFYPLVSTAGDEAWLAAQGLHYLRTWEPVESFFVGGLGQGGHGLLPYYLHTFTLGLAQLALPDPLLAARITSLLAGLLALVLVYEIFGGLEGLLASLLLSLEPTLFLAARHARPEVWLLSLSLAAFLVLQKEGKLRAFFGGLLSFLSAGFHPSGLAILLVAVIFSKRNFLWAILGAGAGLLGVYLPMVGPWLLRERAFFLVNPAQANYAEPLLVRILTDPARQLLRAPLDAASQLLAGRPEFNAYPYSIALALPFAYRARRKALWFFVGSAVALLLVSSSTWRGTQAYLLLLVPALAGLASLRRWALLYPTLLGLSFLGMDANNILKFKPASERDLRVISKIKETVPLKESLGAIGWIAAYWGHRDPERFLVPWSKGEIPEVLERARFLVVAKGFVPQSELKERGFKLLWREGEVSAWRR